MHSLRISVLAGALLLATSAHAADMPYEPAPVIPAPAVVNYGGWYLRGDIGFTNQEVDGLDSVLYEDVDVDLVQKDFDLLRSGASASATASTSGSAPT